MPILETVSPTPTIVKEVTETIIKNLDDVVLLHLIDDLKKKKIKNKK